MKSTIQTIALLLLLGISVASAKETAPTFAANSTTVTYGTELAGMSGFPPPPQN